MSDEPGIPEKGKDVAGKDVRARPLVDELRDCWDEPRGALMVAAADEIEYLDRLLVQALKREADRFDQDRATYHRAAPDPKEA